MRKNEIKRCVPYLTIAESARERMMSNNSDESQSSTTMAEGDPTEERLQPNLTETPDLPSLSQEFTDSNDKAMFAKPYLPNEASGIQSIDSFDSTSAQDTESVGHVEESSACNTLSSTDSIFVHVWSCPTSPPKFIPSSIDSGRRESKGDPEGGQLVVAEGDPIEERLQPNLTEMPDLPSLSQEFTDSNDKAMFAKPYLPNEASGIQSIDSFHSTSAQDTESVGHVEESSACNTLSSTDSLFVHVWSCPTSPPKFIPSSIDSAAPVESRDSVTVSREDSQYAECEETQSVASVALSSTANIMVRRETVEEPRQKTMPTRKSVNVEDKKSANSLFERQSVSIDSGTQVYGKETEEIAHGTPLNTNLPSDEIVKQLDKPSVEESVVRTKEISNIDTCKKNLLEQAATKNKIQFKEQFQVDQGKVKLSLKNDDEGKMQLREQISTGKMLGNQEASGSKLQQDPAFVAETEPCAANTESSPQLSSDIPSASSVTSDPNIELPGASSSTQQAPSRYPPRKVKLTADCLPSWRNMSMTEARRGRGMYGGGCRRHGEDSPPKEKRPPDWARDLPEITVENLKKHLQGRRHVRLYPYKKPYLSLTQKIILEDRAKAMDPTKKKKKKKRRSRYACADDSSSSWSSSDDEPKSPKKSLPPSPELQFHLEL
ncbi:hypothetical protein JTE90_029073 [Oedothorax gibbosus]|uniref:Uncharacterized protein n=1 Tax=Oedothorax gibbosus TaxID=931172 RepID=A0AAV6UWI0_9ARAC|nr:hypothetical protein JTE90_029073 [Oedothorax gibbosus]